LIEPSHFLTDKYSFSDIYKKEIPEGIIMGFDTPIKRIERGQNPRPQTTINNISNIYKKGYPDGKTPGIRTPPKRNIVRWH